MARGSGIADCVDVTDGAGLEALAARLKSSDGLFFARVAIKAEEPPRVLPERDGVTIKQRFREALGLSA